MASAINGGGVFVLVNDATLADEGWGVASFIDDACSAVERKDMARRFRRARTSRRQRSEPLIGGEKCPFELWRPMRMMGLCWDFFRESSEERSGIRNSLENKY